MRYLKAKEIESRDQLPQSQEPAKKGTTVLKTCFNGINTLAGIGILSIPYALSQGGWLSLTFLFPLAVLYWYTGLLLKRCMDTDPAITTYPDIVERAFGYKGRALITLFVYLELYLICVEYLILGGDTLDKLCPHAGLKFAGLDVGGKKGFVLLSALIILPTTWLRSLGLLAYLSAGGIVASIILMGCIFWVGEVDGVGFHERGELWDWGGLTMAISLYTFCYAGISVFPTLATSMKDRSKFPKVLLFCFIASTAIYGSMAVLGYCMYGEHLKSQVTLNLPLQKVSSRIALYTTLASPLTKYAVMITPISTAIEDTFLIHNRVLSVILRTAILISTTVVALTIPFFGYVMAFIGAFLGVSTAIIFPCLCYLRINKSARSFGIELVTIVCILIFGVFVGVIGTYNSVRQILTHL